METKEHKLPFELIVGSETGEIMNGDVPVRWCVTPELVKQLEDDDIKDPHILLVTVTDDAQEMQRQLVPIAELMTYVRFTKAGDMKLYGFIVDGACGRKKLHSTYMQFIANEYATDIIFYYTGQPHDYLPFVHDRTEVTVSIPADVFGKEPGPWMKWFVNLWHNSRSKVVDECHYNRRVMIAFSLKWLPVLIWAAMLIMFRVGVAGAVALAGYYKGNKFWRSFRPYKWGSLEYHILDEINKPADNPFLVKRKRIDKSGDEQTTLMFFTMAFNPLILLIQTFIVWAAAEHFAQNMLIVTAIIFFIGVLWDLGVVLKHWLEKTELFGKMFEDVVNKISAMVEYLDENNRWKYLKWFGYSIIATIVITFSSIFITVGIFLVPVLIVMVLLMVYGEAIIERLNNIYTVAPENNDYTEIRELLCPKDELNLVPDIKLIPPKQRTVRLWYLDMKNKVCKPMQR